MHRVWCDLECSFGSQAAWGMLSGWEGRSEAAEMVGWDQAKRPWIPKCWEPSLWLNNHLFWQLRGFCSDDEIHVLIQQIFIESFQCLKYYPRPGIRPFVPRQAEFP